LQLLAPTCYNAPTMAKKDQTVVLNYRVIIEKDTSEKGRTIYAASCPTLGVFDYGESLDKVLKGIKDGIEGVIEFLTEQKREIPTDRINESLVTFAEIQVSPKSAQLVTV